jgi:hypothetical protein
MYCMDCLSCWAKTSRTTFQLLRSLERTSNLSHRATIQTSRNRYSGDLLISLTTFFSDSAAFEIVGRHPGGHSVFPVDQ